MSCELAAMLKTCRQSGFGNSVEPTLRTGLRDAVNIKFVSHRAERVPALIFDGGARKESKVMSSHAVGAIPEIQWRRGMTPPEAYSLSSVASDCRVTQATDGVTGTHLIVSKSLAQNLYAGCR
jgi:acetamidase/formamidase